MTLYDKFHRFLWRAFAVFAVLFVLSAMAENAYYAAVFFVVALALFLCAPIAEMVRMHLELKRKKRGTL